MIFMTRPRQEFASRMGRLSKRNWISKLTWRNAVEVSRNDGQKAYVTLRDFGNANSVLK